MFYFRFSNNHNNIGTPGCSDIIMRGGNRLSECEETKSYCKSIFKNGYSETTVERYTAAWIYAINLLEETKNDRTNFPEEN